MFGYDWFRLHAALNDLPVALLLAAVLFDLLGAVNKRESLKAAGFWCLFAGVAGGALAGLAGLVAEKRVEHGAPSHALVETHQTLAIVVLVLFTLLLVWRIVRRGLLPRQEQTIFTTAGVIGVGLLIFTANLGGNLVFEHGVGLDGHTLQRAIEERRDDHVHDTADSSATRITPPDSVKRQ